MVDYPRVPPRLEVLVIRGERRVFDVLEMDRLEPLAVDAGEKVEVVRMDGPVAELLDPVALEFVEPAEVEVRVDEAAAEPELHERAQAVQPHPALQRAPRPEPVSAARGGIGRRELGVLLLEEKRNVGLEIVVEIHAASRYPALLAAVKRSTGPPARFLLAFG